MHPAALPGGAEDSGDRKAHSPTERLDVGRRDQAHLMAQLSDLTHPVVRTGIGFHRDNGRPASRIRAVCARSFVT
jgi:hypothetical protein